MKYIHIRQIVTMGLLLTILVIYTLLLCEDRMMTILISVVLVLGGITFIPVTRRELDYNKKLQKFMYYFPMSIWAIDMLINSDEYRIVLSMKIEFYGILGVVVLLVSRWKRIQSIITNPITKVRIERGEFINEIISSSIAIVAEELYFTAFLITKTRNMGIVFSVSISAAIFMYSHYMNRWAKITFNVADYIYILLLGLIKGSVFYYTSNIFGVIVLHVIYNFFDFVVLTKRVISQERSVSISFDDY